MPGITAPQKQMGLKMGPDIMEETKTLDDAGGAKVVKLPEQKLS